MAHLGDAACHHCANQLSPQLGLGDAGPIVLLILQNLHDRRQRRPRLLSKSGDGVADVRLFDAPLSSADRPRRSHAGLLPHAAPSEDAARRLMLV